MKMMCCSGAFWGVLLILFGVLIIIKYVFHIEFPIFRIVIALFFVYIGIKILTGGRKCSVKSDNSAVFSETTFTHSPLKNKYEVVFGKATLDLSDIELQEDKSIEISSVFSEFRIKTNKATNLEINSNTVFGNISTPNNNNTNFGSYTFRSENFDASQPTLKLKVNVVFGQVVIKN